MRKVLLGYSAALAILLCGVTYAQSAAPKVSETDRLTIENLSLRYSNIQLQIKALQHDALDLQTTFKAKIGALEIKGYTLNPDTLEYTPVVETNDGQSKP